MIERNSNFRVVDTKVGTRASYDTLEEARSALSEWIRVQRGAGEPVIELSTGQWKDSKLTVWISGPNEDVVPLHDASGNRGI